MKPIKVVSTKNLNRDDWLEFRKKGIGGSDASAVVGLNPYKSALALWLDKTGQPSEIDNEAIRIGNDMENYVAERFCEATGKKVRKSNFMYQSAEYPFMQANLDRVVCGENAGLECKTTSAYAKSDFENGQIPLTYYVQCMHYMSVMGYDKMYLAVLVLGIAFYWFTIERSEDEITALIESEKTFWNEYVLKNKQPDVDGTESSSNSLNILYPSDNGQSIILSETLFDEYDYLTSQKKEYEEKVELIKQKIQSQMGESSTAESTKHCVSWKKQIRNRVDTKELKAKYPDIHKECLTTSTSRVFKVKIKEEK